MMKTTFDIVDVLYSVLKAGSLKSAITGNVYRNGKRPVNSEKEDVTINPLPVTNEQLQQCIVNINVFVPDTKLTINKVVIRDKNEDRMMELAALAVADLTDGRSGDYTWDIEQQHEFEDEDSDSHFINFRIKFFISNI